MWDREKTNCKQSLTNLDAILAKKINFDPCTMFMEVILTCNCCNEDNGNQIRIIETKLSMKLECVVCNVPGNCISKRRELNNI